ncbi:MAG: hypothetical protein ABIR33_04080 [Pyrinomonadaceae bacterium]
MRTIFRSLSMAAIVAGIAVSGAFAQNVCDDLDGATAKYDGFLKTYASTDVKQLPAIKASLADGKEFLEKWGACESWKEQVAFVKPWVPRVEKKVVDMDKFVQLQPKFDRFDAAIKADNIDEIYGAGKEILAVDPNLHNIKYVMAVSSVVEVAKSLTAKTPSKYAGEAHNHAKSLYDQIKSGSLKLDRKIGDKESIGVLKWERTREEAISQLAYTLGYVNFYGTNNKKGAVPYYYEVTQLPGFYKTYPPVYATLGDFYVEESAPIGAKIADGIKRIAATSVEDEKIKINEEVKANVALFNGYTERALDAYGRAWSIAKADTPVEKTYKDNLLKIVRDLYKRRTDKDTGAEQWVATAVAKPLPNPTSTVEPVSDPDPATTTTTSSTGTGTGVGAANGTGVGAANGTGAAPKAGPTAKAKP